MQTWGIFWVELHRALLINGVVALFLAELSWLGVSRLEQAAQIWFPILSRTRGLAALGCVHVVIATSILSHYLDEFPLVVSWMMFVIGMLYVCLGLAFHAHALKDGRSCFSQKREQFCQGSQSRLCVSIIRPREGLWRNDKHRKAICYFAKTLQTQDRFRQDTRSACIDQRYLPFTRVRIAQASAR